MRAFLLIPFFAALVAGFVQPARSAPNDKAPVVISGAELQWKDLDPTGAPGAKIAKLWGDIGKGPFGAIFQLPPGFAAPLHSHTHDMKVIIVSGTYVQAPRGQPEFRLGPGSYLLQPGGDYQHTTSCEQSTPCIFFVESSGAFDLHPSP